MATERTHRLIGAADDSKLLNSAIRARNRLKEELVKLTRDKLVIEARLAEINDEEEIASAAIDTHGKAVADANAEPDRG